MFYFYRVDLNVFIEDVVGIVSEFVKEGKVWYFGLLEVLFDMICKVYKEFFVSVV